VERISVIVPIYKVEKYLDKCVQSLVDQTYTNLEIILVDDGSPDNCGAMCEAWAKKDSRIKVIHKENGGLSDARNAGLAIATGSLISFVDSDDWVAPDFIQYLYKAIEQTGADLAACGVQEFQEGTSLPPQTIAMPEPERHTPVEVLDWENQGSRYRMVAWNKLYRAELLRNDGFPVGRLHEDEFFTYRIIDRCGCLALVDVPLYHYLQRSGSIMTTFSPRHIDLLDAYLERLELYIKKYPALCPPVKTAFCMACYRLYCEALAKGGQDKGTVLKTIKKRRRKLHVSGAEFRALSLSGKKYVISSLPVMMGLIARLRVLRGIS
jgi:glycosyltransferase involved in cell wall biosynthesis